MKKIIFISYYYYPPFYSGKLIISGKRLQDLNPEKFQVKVLTSGVKGYADYEKIGNVNVYRSSYIGTGKLFDRLNVIAFWIWSFKKVLLEKNISVIHFDEVGYFSIPIFGRLGNRLAWSHFTVLAKLARKRKIRTIYEHAISDRDDHFAPEHAKKQFIDQITHIVSVSRALHVSVSHFHPGKARQIVCGIEDDLFKPLSAALKIRIREENDTNPNTIILCFVGLVVKRKGFDLICEVFPKIVEEFPECLLWVIGPKSHAESRHIHDDEVEAYQTLLKSVEEKVKFFGNIADRQKLAEMIGATDIFLFPTRQEGFGLAPTEAMACGVPPIIARIPGVTDLASIEGVTGLYIPTENADELHQAIRKLVENPTLRKQMGLASREQIESNFSWNQHVEKWEQLYCES